MLNENLPKEIEGNCESIFSSYQYNDGLRSGRRRPRLYLAKGAEIQKFEGKNISGFCAIASEKYEKGGKWSNTDYTLRLPIGVRPLHFLSPLHQTWGDNFTSWGEVCEYLSLPIDITKAIIQNEYPKTAKRLDDLEEFVIKEELEGKDAEMVVISFGSPTNRSIREGYWSKPKSKKTSFGQKVTILPDPEWSKPRVLEPNGAKIISSKHSPGMHGGYWAIEIMVPYNPTLVEEKKNEDL